MAEPHGIGVGLRKRRDKRKEAQSPGNQSAGAGSQSAKSSAEGNATRRKSYDAALIPWIKILGLCTLVLSIATIVSAYLLFATNQTIKRQVTVTHTQLRAYIGSQQIIYVPKLSVEPGNPETFLGSAIGITWRNFGATPAKEFDYWISAKWYPPGLEPDFAKPSDDIPGHTFTTLGPGIESPSAPLFVPAADVEKAMAGQGRIFFWGEASYRDVFPDTPQRHFRFCLVALGMPKAVNEPAAFNVVKAGCNSSD